MKTTLIRAAALAAILAMTAIGASEASPVRPLPEARGTTATQVQYYGGYNHHHTYRPPHHAYHPPHHSYRHGYESHYTHHGGYDRRY